MAKAVSEAKTHLQTSKLASRAAADAFVALVPVFRDASKDAIAAVLSDSKNKKIL